MYSHLDPPSPKRTPYIEEQKHIKNNNLNLQNNQHSQNTNTNTNTNINTNINNNNNNQNIQDMQNQANKFKKIEESPQQNDPNTQTQFNQMITNFIDSALGFSINDTIIKDLEQEFKGQELPSNVKRFFQKTKQNIESIRKEALSPTKTQQNAKETIAIEPDIEKFEYGITCIFCPLTEYYNLTKYKDELSMLFNPNFSEKPPAEISLHEVLTKINQKIQDIEIRGVSDKSSLFYHSLKNFRKKYLSKIKDKNQTISVERLSDLFGNIIDSISKKKKIDENSRITEVCLKQFEYIFKKEQEQEQEPYKIRRELESLIFLLQESFSITDEIRDNLLEKMEFWKKFEPNLDFLRDSKKKLKEIEHYQMSKFDRKSTYILWYQKAKSRIEKNIKFLEESKKRYQLEQQALARQNRRLESKHKLEKEMISDQLATIKLTLLEVRGLEGVIKERRTQKLYGIFEYEGLKASTEEIDTKKLTMWKKQNSTIFDVIKMEKQVHFTLWGENIYVQKRKKFKSRQAIGKIDLDVDKLVFPSHRVSWLSLEPSMGVSFRDAEAKIEIEYIENELLQSKKKGQQSQEYIIESKKIDYHEIFKTMATRVILFVNNFFRENQETSEISRQNSEENQMQRGKTANALLNKQNLTSKLNWFQKEQSIFGFASSQLIIRKNIDAFFQEFCLRYGIHDNFYNLVHLRILVDNFKPAYNIITDIKALLSGLYTVIIDFSYVGLTIEEETEFESILLPLYLNVRNHIQHFSMVFENNKPTNCLKEMINVYLLLIKIDADSRNNISFVSKTRKTEMIMNDNWEKKGKEVMQSIINGILHKNKNKNENENQNENQNENENENENDQKKHDDIDFLEQLAILIMEGFEVNYSQFFEVKAQSKVQQDQDAALKLIEAFQEDLKSQANPDKIQMLQAKIASMQEKYKGYEEGFACLVLTEKITYIHEEMATLANFFANDTFPKELPLLPIATRYYTTRLSDSIFQCIQGSDFGKIEIFRLYKKIRDVNDDIGQHSAGHDIQLIPVSKLFFDQARVWISSTKERLQSWIERAVELDTLDMLSPQNPISSSSIDVFQMVDRVFAFLTSLNWKEPNFHFLLLKFTKTLCKLVNTYTTSLDSRLDRIIILIRQEVPIGKDIGLDFFVPENHLSVFVLLNDMDYARQTLNHLYSDIESFTETIENDSNTAHIKSTSESVISFEIPSLKAQFERSFDKLMLLVKRHIILKLSLALESHLEEFGGYPSLSKSTSKRVALEKDQKLNKPYARGLVNPTLSFLNVQLERSASLFRSQTLFNKVLVSFYMFSMLALKRLLTPILFPNFVEDQRLELTNPEKLFSSRKRSFKIFPKDHFAVFGFMLELINEFFYADGDGLSQSMIDSYSQDVVVLFDLFSLSIDRLFDFVTKQTVDLNFTKEIISRSFDEKDKQKLSCILALDIIYSQSLIDRNCQNFIQRFSKQFISRLAEENKN
ncbi:unc-13-4a isoform b [Anaeramoeba ignava]|uniref:Unc-13-4a isoform b n=1 Tax=Anaeramoeba ignava TaxID=1746090 RepID=A0A9Q0RAZ1_ANAIG|nr:unc-13-4a isoform b [Anaeramoeba ignava]